MDEEKQLTRREMTMLAKKKETILNIESTLQCSEFNSQRVQDCLFAEKFNKTELNKIYKAVNEIEQRLFKISNFIRDRANKPWIKFPKKI